MENKAPYIYLAGPWGPKGGGMFKVSDYLIQNQASPPPGHAELRHLDTRGNGNALLSMLMLAIAVGKITTGRLSGRLVEGRMRFRDADYLLALRGLAQSANSTGTVWGLHRTRDIEGHYQASDQGFRNSAGVTIRFDPPLVLEKDRLEIELLSRRTPKASQGLDSRGE